MQELSRSNFGIVIGFLLPGAIALQGLIPHSTAVKNWLASDPASDATIGGFLFAALVALFLGLLCSTVRWLVLDWIHHHTGVSPPRRDFRRLQANLGAYRMIEENHYQYYQFYGNSLVAVLACYLSFRWNSPQTWLTWTDLPALSIAVLLFLGSRDTLQKYYRRVEDLLRCSTSLILPSRSL
ncbi:MAG: hypothetical protein AAFV88_24375 [Planctomycetota bacterium]